VVRPSILLLALCSLPPTVILVAEAAAPKLRPTARVFAVQPDVPRARPNVQRKIDPKLAAAAVSILRRFATDAADPTDLDLAFAKRTKRLGSARATAKRVLGRIDALSPTTIERTFGGAKAMSARHSSGTVAKLAPKAKLAFVPAWAQPTVVIPAEVTQAPQQLKLVLAGIASTAAADADGTDEVVVAAHWIDLVEASGHASTPASGTSALAAGETVASGEEIFFGNDRPALLVSGVFEDDDGSAATAREDYQLMVELAKSLSAGMVAADDLAKLELALTTCAGLLQISDPQRFGAGAIVWTRFGGESTTLHDLYATPASQTGGVAWKARHDHVVGGGTYEVLFDVPAPPPPDLPKINVKIVSVESLTATEHEPPETTTKLDLAIDVAVKNQGGSWTFPNNDNDPSAGMTFSRIVQPGPVHIEVLLRDRPTEVDGCWIGGWGSSNCFYTTGVDLSPGASSTVKLDFDPATGDITGDKTGKAGDQLTFEGTASGKPKGRVVLVVTAQ
jgi:hypothetical protein